MLFIVTNRFKLRKENNRAMLLLVYIINKTSFKHTSTYFSFNRGDSPCFRSVSSDPIIFLKKIIILPEIGPANMTDHVILAPIVLALWTKLIAGTLAAVLSPVGSISIYSDYFLIPVPSLNPGLRRWKGCACALTGRVCGTKRCSCFRANVECDPDVCLSCGTKYVIIIIINCVINWST